MILHILLRPWKLQGNGIHFPFDGDDTQHPFQKVAIWISVFYFLSSFLLSLLLMYFPQQLTLLLLISAALTLAFIIFFFFVPLKANRINHSKQVLLTIPDCYNELPMRGFVYVGIAVVLAGLLYAFNMHEYFSSWSALVMKLGVPTFVLFLLIALATSFSTEVLSNTAVQISFFLMALPLAQQMGLSALVVLIIITLSCTCAFMSPIATGVNGLAFGGVKGVSFTKMLLVGLVMNIAGALLISGWVLGIISRLYHL